ncbi:MAG: hypothetical protein MUF18_12440 [Fimbriiglobus sp.]|jgi:hypothetical protein|nr:hypothetical protein [Fimbriiglobus sp.]
MPNLWKPSWLVLVVLTTALVAVPATAGDPNPNGSSVWPTVVPTLVDSGSNNVYTLQFDGGNARARDIFSSNTVKVQVMIRKRNTSTQAVTNLLSNRKDLTTTYSGQATINNFTYNTFDFAGGTSFTYLGETNYVYEYKLWLVGKRSGQTDPEDIATYPTSGWAPVTPTTSTGGSQ